MKIYLTRHAEALSQADWRGNDADRPLSKAGRAQLGEAVKAMEKAGFSASVIATSPLKRALETAQLLSPLSKGAALEVLPALSSGASSVSIRDVAQSFFGKGSLLIVGHMPDVAQFAARCVGDIYILEEGFKPGEIMALETGPNQLVWGEAKILWRRKLDDWRNLVKTEGRG